MSRRLPHGATFDQRSTSTTTTAAARPGKTTNRRIASSAGSSTVKSTPSSWTTVAPPSKVLKATQSGNRTRRDRTRACGGVEHAVDPAEQRHQEHEGQRARRDDADLEAVVGDHPDRLGRRGEPQEEHRETAADPADHEARDRARSHADEHPPAHGARDVLARPLRPGSRVEGDVHRTGRYEWEDADVALEAGRPHQATVHGQPR